MVAQRRRAILFVLALPDALNSEKQIEEELMGNFDFFDFFTSSVPSTKLQINRQAPSIESRCLSRRRALGALQEGAHH